MARAQTTWTNSAFGYRRHAAATNLGPRARYILTLHKPLISWQQQQLSQDSCAFASSHCSCEAAILGSVPWSVKTTHSMGPSILAFSAANACHTAQLFRQATLDPSEVHEQNPRVHCLLLIMDTEIKDEDSVNSKNTSVRLEFFPSTTL